MSHWLGCKVRIKSRTPRDFIQSLEVTLAADSRLGFLLAFLLAEENLRVSVLAGKRLTRQLAILHFPEGTTCSLAESWVVCFQVVDSQTPQVIHSEIAQTSRKTLCLSPSSLETFDAEEASRPLLMGACVLCPGFPYWKVVWKTRIMFGGQNFA